MNASPREQIQTNLFRAARAGDDANVLAALDQDADIDARDTHGDTALHLAARHGHAMTAACLLANHASHDIRNRDGHRALDEDHIGLGLLHEIRQRYHRIRQPRLPDDALVRPVSRHWLRELKARGIVRLPAFLAQQELQQMQVDFRAFIDTLNRSILRRQGLQHHYDEEESWWPQDRAYISNNAFKYSKQLVALCCRDELLGLIRAYLGIAPSISRGVAMRYLPDNEKHSDMFGWHHDMEEQRLKVLILLTDVGTNDQHMSYVSGSHMLYHPLEMFYDNPCSLDYCRRSLGDVDIIDATGQAGDVFLFDSNGAHRGNRKPDGAVRDTFFVEFTSDPSDIWGGDLPSGGCSDQLASADSPFARFMSARKKWNCPMTRKAPAWVENLIDVACWR